MMKIGILGPAHPYRGGIAAFTERMAQALIAAGHEVTIYTYTLQYPSFMFPGKTQFTDKAPPTGLTIIRCCLLYTSPSPRDKRQSRMPSSA